MAKDQIYHPNVFHEASATGHLQIQVHSLFENQIFWPHQSCPPTQSEQARAGCSCPCSQTPGSYSYLPGCIHGAGQRLPFQSWGVQGCWAPRNAGPTLAGLFVYPLDEYTTVIGFEAVIADRVVTVQIKDKAKLESGLSDASSRIRASTVTGKQTRRAVAGPGPGWRVPGSEPQADGQESPDGILCDLEPIIQFSELPAPLSIKPVIVPVLTS